MAEAESLSWKVLTIKETTFGKEHPSLVTSLNNLAWVLQIHKPSVDVIPYIDGH